MNLTHKEMFGIVNGHVGTGLSQIEFVYQLFSNMLKEQFWNQPHNLALKAMYYNTIKDVVQKLNAVRTITAKTHPVLYKEIKSQFTDLDRCIAISSLFASILILDKERFLEVEEKVHEMIKGYGDVGIIK